MKDLEFVVSGQTLTSSGDLSGIIRGSKNYLRAVVKFDDPDWMRCTGVVAAFKNRGSWVYVPINNGSCMVPDEVSDLRQLEFKLLGRTNTGGIITTNTIKIFQREG